MDSVAQVCSRKMSRVPEESLRGVWSKIRIKRGAATCLLGFKSLS